MTDPTEPSSTEPTIGDTPSKTFDAREEAIIAELNNEPDGLSFNQLADRVADQMARNTLQQRVTNLTNDGVIEQDPRTRSGDAASRNGTN